MFVLGGLAGADPADRRMRPVGGGWWERSYELERDVRTAYWFTHALAPSGADALIPDPLNPRRHLYTADPEVADDEEVSASLVELPGARPFRWSVRDERVPRGTTSVHRLRSALLGNERRVYTYVPPEYDGSRRYPLVVCFDGRAYVDEAYVPLPTVLDNLIAAGSIPPVVAVLPDSLDSETRSRELRLDEAFVEFLVGSCCHGHTISCRSTTTRRRPSSRGRASA